MTNIGLTMPDLAAFAGRFGRTPTSSILLHANEKPLLRGLADELWSLGEWVFGIPAAKVRPAPDVQVMARELRQWTGWSTRRLAEILSTTHTTIRALEEGRPLMAGHSGDLRRRLEEAYAVILRVHLLADRDPARTAHLLETTPSTGPLAAAASLKARNPAKAYLAALDVLNPPADGLLVGTRPARPGRATAPLHE